MKKICFLLPVLLLLFASCNNHEKTADNTLEKKADSLYDEVMEGHNIGMAKDRAIEKARQLTQRAIDSIGKLPAAAQVAAAGYKTRLDSLLKDLNYAGFAMEKWMNEMNWKPDSMEVEKRINYLTDEKLKVDKVKDAILGSLAKADSLLKTKF